MISSDYFNFKVLKQSTMSNARLGLIHTPHGDVRTPAFIFCGTKANVKGITPFQLHEAGTQIILSNTYHLLLQPGIDVLRKAGGLQKFTGWNAPMFTDSGGFQIFCLGYGSVCSEIKGIKSAPTRKTLLTVTEEGATFRSYLNGNKILLTPELSIQAQIAFGADIIVCLDECAPHHTSKMFTAEAMMRSKRWASRCLAELERSGTGKQALSAVIQGGIYGDLRRESADFANKNAFDCFAIGGSLGITKQQMFDITQMTCEMLDRKRHVHLLGIGGIPDIFNGVKCGIDTFDCVSPTRIARHGIALIKASEKEQSEYGLTKTSEQDPSTKKANNININHSRFVGDTNPISFNCDCYTCKTVSRSYIHHLFRADEMLGGQLISLHNIRFMNKLMEDIRSAIANDTLDKCQSEYLD